MNLKSKVINLEKQLDAYRSSKKYDDLRIQHIQNLKEKDIQIKKLKEEMVQDSLRYKKSRREWMKVNEELQKQSEKICHQKDKTIKQLQEYLSQVNIELSALYEASTRDKMLIEKLQTQLEIEQAKNGKLKAQINKNYENSSIPSSASPYRKKIENSRESSGKKQGGQRGHQGYRRKQYEATEVKSIEAPSEYLDTTKYKATGKIIKKQVVNMHIALEVIEYRTPEYRDLESRQKVHGEFPEGVINEINFGASVQAMAFLLNHHYNVSTAKTCDFLHEASGGVFSISTGCVNQLSKKFAQKTKQQQAEIFDGLVKAAVMNTDYTTARVDGKLVQVLICATKDMMMYYGREHKGFEGVKDTPVEFTTNTLVHDHESTFRKYGSRHQECIVHILRRIQGSIENEKELSWNKRMYDTMRKMIHYVKTEKEDQEKVEALIKEYDINLEIAELNYKEHPPTEYYREGYNLAKQLKEYRDDHLLFLLERGIPYDNNLSERYARVIKRKMRQMTTFRSFESFEHICASLGVIESLRSQGGNLLDKVVDIFDVQKDNLTS